MILLPEEGIPERVPNDNAISGRNSLPDVRGYGVEESNPHFTPGSWRNGGGGQGVGGAVAVPQHRPHKPQGGRPCVQHAMAPIEKHGISPPWLRTLCVVRT